jgi:hypothetical protein
LRCTTPELWKLWTTKDGFESWWGPEGFRADVHTIEAREEFSNMQVLGLTSQLNKLDRRFGNS